jgi:peroxiredoxin
MLEQNTLAPTFALRATNGETTALERLRGKWVLLNWYDPKVQRSCAPIILTNMVKNQASFRKADCEPLGIVLSEEEEADVLAKRYGLPLLVDTERTVSAQYHALRTDFVDIPKRIAYLLDPEGKVAVAFGYLDPDFFVDDVLSTLRNLTTV